MKLLDAIAHLDKLDDELIIFMEDLYDEESDVVLLTADEDGEVVREHKGKTYNYLIEIIFAKKIVAEWKETLGSEPDVNAVREYVYAFATKNL